MYYHVVPGQDSNSSFDISKNSNIIQLCIFKKNALPTPSEFIGNSEGEVRFQNPQFVKGCEANLEFPEGWGIQAKSFFG